VLSLLGLGGVVAVVSTAGVGTWRRRASRSARSAVASG
jgi:hypothetical protein